MSIQDQQETVSQTVEIKARGGGARGLPPGRKNALKHGYYSLLKLIQSRHGALDKRTVLGKMVVETANQLTADLGGDVSTAQKMLIQDVAIDTLLLQALQARLDVVPIRKGRIHPVYTLRAQLIAQRREHLKLLGIHRVPKTLSLQEILAKHDDDDTPANTNGTGEAD